MQFVYLLKVLPLKSKSGLEDSDKRISVGVTIVRTAQKKKIKTKVLSVICLGKVKTEVDATSGF